MTVFLRGSFLQRTPASVVRFLRRRVPPFSNIGCNLLLLTVLLFIMAVAAGESLGQWRMHREAQHLRQTLAQLEAQRASLAQVRTVLHEQGIGDLYGVERPGTFQGFTRSFWGLGDCRVFVSFTVDSEQRLQGQKVEEDCQSF